MCWQLVLVALFWAMRLGLPGALGEQLAAKKDFDSTKGFPGEGPAAESRPAVVPLVTLNVTAWSTWKEVFERESKEAQIWMLQEHKIKSVGSIKAAKKAMRAAGWASVFTKAATTAAGGASGGTAILVRDHWDVTEVRRISGPAAHRAV